MEVAAEEALGLGKPIRIAIFNVKYSPNLGDGLLSECLEAELRAQNESVSAYSIDLAGRTDYGPPSRHRRTALALLHRLPGSLRRLIARSVLRRAVQSQLLPSFRDATEGADAFVVGGGNLFADADLNFPMKISAAMQVVGERGKPVCVFGVGVGADWSNEGAQLFRTALTRVSLVSAAVRDQRSRQLWQHQLGDRVAIPDLCRDPGLLAARIYPAEPAPSAKRVGLCLTDRVALRYHGALSADRRLDDWLCEFSARMSHEGFMVDLFTNGSPEDRAYLDQLAPRIADACVGPVRVVPPFDRPEGLARFISGCTLVVGHRMHACIAAYSFGVPQIGLCWDPKLESFFASVDRSAYFVDPAATRALDAAAIAVRALEEGIDSDLHRKVVDEAAADVRRLYTQLLNALVR